MTTPIAAQVDTLSALNAAVQAFTVAFDRTTRTTRAREAEEMLRAAELAAELDDAAEVA